MALIKWTRVVILLVVAVLAIFYVTIFIMMNMVSMRLSFPSSALEKMTGKPQRTLKVENDVTRLAQQDIVEQSTSEDMLDESAVECYRSKVSLYQQRDDPRPLKGPEHCWVTNLYYISGELTLRQSTLKYLPHLGGKSKVEPIQIMPHLMGWFQPVNLHFDYKVPTPNLVVHEKTYMYGMWHIFNYGHWIHDNLIALYATMMEKGGIDRNNRIVTLAVHQWDRPIDEESPYIANPKFLEAMEVFTKHKVIALSDYDATGSVLFKDVVIGVSKDYIMYELGRDESQSLLQEVIIRGFVKMMLNYYKIKTHGNRKPIVGIIQRVSDKRFIINMDELVEGVSFNGQVEVVPLHFGSMSIQEQIASVHNLDVLIGITGSDCNNAMFLSETSTFIQLTPYKCENDPTKSACPGKKIKNQVQLAGIQYIDWTNSYLFNTEFPWHQWDRINCEDEYRVHLSDEVKERITNTEKPDGCIVWDFYQNQNTWVELSEVLPLVHEALLSSGHNVVHTFPVTQWVPNLSNLALKLNKQFCLGITLNNDKSQGILGTVDCNSFSDNIERVIIEGERLVVIRNDNNISYERCIIPSFSVDDSSAHVLQIDDCLSSKSQAVTWIFNMYEMSICVFSESDERWCFNSVTLPSPAENGFTEIVNLVFHPVSRLPQERHMFPEATV